MPDPIVTAFRLLEEAGYESLPLGRAVLAFVHRESMEGDIAGRVAEDFNPRLTAGLKKKEIKRLAELDGKYGRDLNDATANSAARVVAAQAVTTLEVELRRMILLAISVTESILIRRGIERLPKVLPRDDNGDFILARGDKSNHVLTQSAWKSMLAAARAEVVSPSKTREQILAGLAMAARAVLASDLKGKQGRRSHAKQDLEVLEYRDERQVFYAGATRAAERAKRDVLAKYPDLATGERYRDTIARALKIMKSRALKIKKG